MPRGRVRLVPAVLVVVAALLCGGLVARSASGADKSGFPHVARVAGPTTAAVPGATVGAAAAASVAVAPTTWVTTTHSITSGGLARTYLVEEPSPAPTGKVPVVVVLHGSNVSPSFEEQRTGFVPEVGSAILVYPAGYDETWNSGSCCGGAHAAGVNDVAFITAVVAQVLAQHSDANAAKVDLVGYSNGGRMAWTLACDDPQVFRALAVYGAVLDKACSHLGPISGMEIAGLADPELTINSSKPPTVSFGFTEPTVTALAEQLLTSDGCRSPATASRVGLAVTDRWSNCAAGRQVALTLYQGQNHTWPAGSATTPSGAAVIWKFFRSIGAT